MTALSPLRAATPARPPRSSAGPTATQQRWPGNAGPAAPAHPTPDTTTAPTPLGESAPSSHQVGQPPRPQRAFARPASILRTAVVFLHARASGGIAKSTSARAKAGFQLHATTARPATTMAMRSIQRRLRS